MCKKDDIISVFNLVSLRLGENKNGRDKIFKTSRNRIPEVLHLMRLGYSYLSCENKKN